MPNKSEKEKRKELKQAYKANEQQQILASLPISVEALNELFVWLDAQFEEYDCDDTFRLTQIFIEKNNLPKIALLEWLEKHGGYCDCEVLANVAEHFED
jgi:hypothetical protein